MSDFFNNNDFFNIYQNSIKDSKFKYIFFVSTFNRNEYLSNFLKSLINTIDLSQNNLIIIGNNNLDDRDKIKDIIKNINLPIILQNNIIRGVAYQLAQCINLIKKNSIKFKVLFCCDNDIVFIKKGWTHLYNKQIRETKMDHLCYFSTEQFLSTNRLKFQPTPKIVNNLKYLFNIKYSQGCFFTITPNIIKNIGYPDYFNFPVRGDWHEDYSLRCCRKNYNNSETFFDVNNFFCFCSCNK